VSDKVSDNGVLSDKMSDNYVLSDKISDKYNVSDKVYRNALLARLTTNGEVSASEAAVIIGRSAKTARRVLLQLVDEGIVAATGANRNRKYKTAK
jgi:predicted ArsR family transcriptional regulator